MASLPASTASTVYSEAGPVAGRYGVDADDLAHRVIEKFIDHRRSCSRTSCSTCDGQIDTRFVRRSLKNEAIDIRNELKMRGQRETDAARPELSSSSDPAIVIEADETEELLKYSASDLARLARTIVAGTTLSCCTRWGVLIARSPRSSRSRSPIPSSRCPARGSISHPSGDSDFSPCLPSARSSLVSPLRCSFGRVALHSPRSHSRALPCRPCHCPPKTFRGWSCQSRILSARRFPTVRSMKESH